MFYYKMLFIYYIISFNTKFLFSLNIYKIYRIQYIKKQRNKEIKIFIYVQAFSFCYVQYIFYILYIHYKVCTVYIYCCCCYFHFGFLCFHFIFIKNSFVFFFDYRKKNFFLPVLKKL